MGPFLVSHVTMLTLLVKYSTLCQMLFCCLLAQKFNIVFSVPQLKIIAQYEFHADDTLAIYIP